MNTVATPAPPSHSHSLAPAAQAQINLGTVAMGPAKGSPYTMPLTALGKHVLITGRTGSGKSVLIKALTEELICHGVPVVIFDVMGDLSGLALPLGSVAEYLQLGLTPPVAEDHKWDEGAVRAGVLRDRIHPRILTPWSDAGERLAIPVIASCPAGFDPEDSQQHDDLLLQADTMAYGLMSRIGGKAVSSGGPTLEHTFLTTTIVSAWKENIEMDGAEGLKEFAKFVRQQPNSVISETAQERLANAIEAQTMGTNALWLKGVPLDWGRLLGAPRGKTACVIISLQEMPRETHPWAVGQMLQSLVNHVARIPSSSGRMRLGVVVDELAGEGGHMALLPPGNVKPNPSGAALKRILRVGRHAGISLIAGSQSANDVEYKLFSQFNFLATGALKTPLEISRVTACTDLGEKAKENLSNYILRAGPGQFFILPPNGTYTCLDVRWIGSAHTKIERDLIRHLYDQGYLRRVKAGPASVATPESQAVEALESLLRRHEGSLSPDARQMLRSAIAAQKATVGSPG